MTPLLGFAPDIDATVPGVLVDCENLIPYKSGMEAAPSQNTPTDVPAIGAACTGAASLSKLDGTTRVFAGTGTQLLELVSGVWEDRSSATYTGGTSRWSFAQFGDSTIATNRVDAMQVSTSTTFAAVGGSSPKAEIVFSVSSFVMALNVNDGSEKTNGWHCCASFDATDWVESVTTQSASGTLVATPGPITAGMRLGEYAVAYKERSMYLGQYVGAPSVWDWILVPGGNAGCVGKEAVCDVREAHFFVGTDNFWLFDGTAPKPIGDDQIRQWFFDNADPDNLHKTICTFEHQQNRVWIFFPSSGSSTLDSAIVYHLKHGKWGRANRSIEAALNYAATGLTYDSWDDAGATYDGLQDISYNSPYWLVSGPVLAVFNTSHQLQTMTGAPDACSFTTGDAGEDDILTLLQGVRVRFAAGSGPDTATCTAYRKMNSGDSFAVGDTVSINDGKFDVLQEARWHRAVINMTGRVRVTAIRPKLDRAGER